MAGVCVCDVRALCTSCVRLEPHTTQCARAIRKFYWCPGCWPMCCWVSHQIRPSFMTFGTNCNRKARPSLCGLDAKIPWCPIDFLFLRHFHSNETSLTIRWIISALPVRPVSFELRKEKTPRRQIYFFINETECLASLQFHVGINGSVISIFTLSAILPYRCHQSHSRMPSMWTSIKTNIGRSLRLCFSTFQLTCADCKINDPIRNGRCDNIEMINFILSLNSRSDLRTFLPDNLLHIFKCHEWWMAAPKTNIRKGDNVTGNGFTGRCCYIWISIDVHAHCAVPQCSWRR